MKRLDQIPFLEIVIGLIFISSLSLCVYLLQLTAWFLPQTFVLATIQNCRQFFVSSSQELIGSGVIVFGMFFLGLILTLFTIIGSFLKLRYQNQELNQITTQAPANLKKLIKQFKLKSNQIVILNTPKVVACTVGLLNPQIVFSKGLINKLNTKELEAVLCHEFKHLKNRHGLCLFLFGLLQQLFWMVPIFSLTRHKVKYLFELRADQEVISYFKDAKYLNQAKLSLSQEPHTRFEFSLNFSDLNILRTQIKVSKLEIVFKSVTSFVTAILIFWCLVNLNRPLEVNAYGFVQSNQSCISNTTIETVCKQKLSVTERTCEWRNYSTI